ncbi:T9SS type A sorting domain-containing protein [Crocinitomix catalasitica]|uniref:T9SS type A sorting domain-containing protein n=1 Tax=Crocinitomix catalasitica TaxID=184607 RepID=UPI0009FE1F28|nr:T9SS type A sorting domain-containing protein [Crocinitomix catalasitica]
MIDKICFFVLTFISGSLYCQYTSIPDNNFEQALIYLDLDDEIDGLVLTENIDTLKTLHVPRMAIASLSGIEDFTALENLNCEINYLDYLNLTSNTNLIYLTCSFNYIDRIDLGHNPNLLKLICSDNQLSFIDLSGCENLYYLQCSSNLFTSIDISANPNLHKLKCGKNYLRGLDVSSQSHLLLLSCRFNEISALDLSNNALLTSLECENNYINELDLTITPNLEFLNCSHNPLSSLDLSQNLALRFINCSHSDITTLNLDHNSKLDVVKSVGTELNSLSIRNGNNENIESEFDFFIRDNPNLYCIAVDNPTYSENAWTEVDEIVSFRENCNTLTATSSTVINYQIYPNPAKEFLTIEIEQKADQFSLHDLSGKEIRSGHLNQGSNSINLEEMAPGLYILHIAGEDISLNERIVIE